MSFQSATGLALAAGVSLLALTAAAGAADLALDSRIAAVTVFPSEAQVLRLGTVRLTPGDHVLRLQGLPARVDANSVTVKAKAGFSVEIGSVDVKRVVPAPLPVADRPGTERKIADLSAQRAIEEDALSVARDRIKFVDGLAAAIAGQLPSTESGARLDMAGIRDVAAFSQTERQAANAEIRRAEIKIRDLDIEIERLRKTLQQEIPSAQPTMEVAIALTSAGGGDAEFSVEYRLPDARWWPVYEARLATGTATEKPALAFSTRAAISQRTGEDWTDVKLTLSTTRPSKGTGIGNLPVVTANLYEPRPVMPMAAPAPGLSLGAAPKAAAPARLADEDAAPEPEAAAKPIAATERQASVDTVGTTVVYAIPGTVQIASGPDVKTLKVTSEQVEPTLAERIVPRLSPVAYLTASFVRTADGALMPGQVNIFRDGVYVGQTALAQTGPGETIRLGFGEDERVKVIHAPLKQQDGETGTFSTSRIQKRDAKITIINNAALPLAMVVEEQLPVSENTDVKVDALSTNTAPQQTGLDGRRGSVAWTFDLKPRESKEIRFGWQVKWPADKLIRFGNVAK